MSILRSLLSPDPRYRSVRGLHVLSSGPVYFRVDTYGVKVPSTSWGPSSGGTQNVGPPVYYTTRLHDFEWDDTPPSLTPYLGSDKVRQEGIDPYNVRAV